MMLILQCARNWGRLSKLSPTVAFPKLYQLRSRGTKKARDTVRMNDFSLVLSSLWLLTVYMYNTFKRQRKPLVGNNCDARDSSVTTASSSWSIFAVTLGISLLNDAKSVAREKHVSNEYRCMTL